MSDAQRGAASQLIFQMLSGRLGWNIHDMNRADGLEIYISQGAKPGLGGQLMAKVTLELARIRGIPHGIEGCTTSTNGREHGFDAPSAMPRHRQCHERIDVYVVVSDTGVVITTAHRLSSRLPAVRRGELH